MLSDGIRRILQALRGLSFSRPSARRRRRRGTMYRLESLEPRALLAMYSLTAVADGTVADRNLDGTFETALSSDTSVLDRWFNFSNIGEERGAFEFDLSRFAPGTQVVSAKLGVYVTSFTSSSQSGGPVSYPQYNLFAYAGDGLIGAADATSAGTLLANGTITALGYQEITLDGDALESQMGQSAGVRLQNTQLSGNWFSVASLEDTFRSDPVLILEVSSGLSLTFLGSEFSEGAGPQGSIGVLTRTGDITTPLTVQLSSSDVTEATVPDSLTFAAGQWMRSFDVAAVDDDILDGTQSVTISASATLTDGTPVGLDTSFSGDGLANSGLLMRVQFPRMALTIQPDGRILAASELSGSSWKLTRFLPDGAVDTSFGNGTGWVSTTLPGTNPVPHRIVVQPDGKILVGGKFASGFGTGVLVRYNADGSMDTGFGNRGLADLANSAGWVNDLAVRDNGKILVGIAFNGTSRFRTWELNANGSFSSYRTHEINDLVQAIEFLPDGRYLLVGSRMIARFNANDTLDTTYAVNGIQTVQTTGERLSTIFDAELGADGKLSLAMNTYVSNTNSTHDMAAARLNADGSIDTSFAGGGIVEVDFYGLNDMATSIALQADGKIVLAGFTEYTSGVRDVAFVKFNNDGSLDTLFDGDGRFQIHVVPDNAELALGLDVQADGKLVTLAGWASDFRLARLHPGFYEIPLDASGVVSVLDNENHPPTLDPHSFQVRENTVVGTLVGTVTGDDADGHALVYSIVSGNDGETFSIDAATGEVKVADNTLLDAETRELFLLTVRVTDPAGAYAEADVAVTVLQVNESPVVDDQTFVIDENTPNEVVVGTVAASDPDMQVGDFLFYEFVSGHESGVFSIDSSTGAITVGNTGQLNYEVQQTFPLVVRVTDIGLLSDEANVTIALRNVNETPSIDDAAFNIDENTANGFSVGTVSSTDPDFDDSPSYAIIEGNASGAFAINADTGEITVADSSKLNFESTPAFLLTVRVTDDGELTDDAAVAISLNDVNESPFLGAAAFTIAENSPNGTPVGTVSGTDPDAGQSLSYAIVAGNGSGAFAINAATGEITVADTTKLDYETTPVFNLTVRATDSGQPSLSAEAAVSVTLTDVNDPPVIAAQTLSIRERSANGTVVGDVSASDADAGQTLTHAIVGGNTGGAFAIDAATGQITVANQQALDFETTPVFSLTVRVTDSGNPALWSEAAVSVQLTDVADAGLDVLPGNSSNTITLGQTQTVQVAILSTSEVDARLIDLNSLRFGRTGTEDSIVRNKKGQIVAQYTDVNGDGRLDLIVTFDVARAGFLEGDTKAYLTGSLTDGTAFEASDTIVVKKKPGKR